MVIDWCFAECQTVINQRSNDIGLRDWENAVRKEPEEMNEDLDLSMTRLTLRLLLMLLIVLFLIDVATTVMGW